MTETVDPLPTSAEVGADDPESPKPKRGRGGSGFFAIDRKTWIQATELGMNPAVAVLVMARFSARDNRTTRASVAAIERYTGISRGRARKAIGRLEKAKLVSAAGPHTRPVYTIVADSCPVLSEPEGAVLAKVRKGEALAQGDLGTARSLTTRGVLRPDGSKFAVARLDDWIWLPNTLVTGAAGEVPPLELLRETQDVMCLRLLVDLYYLQDLRDNGGVSWRAVSLRYDRHRVGQRGQYVVWGFSERGEVVDPHGVLKCHARKPTNAEQAEGWGFSVDLFRRLDLVHSLGLLEYVPYVYEGDGVDAEPLFPVGNCAEHGEIEHALGQAAHRAGLALLTEPQRAGPEYRGLVLVPLPAHLVNAQLFGVVRLRYRPHTRRTRAWYAKLHEQSGKWLSIFLKLAGEALPDLATSRSTQGT